MTRLEVRDLSCGYEARAVFAAATFSLAAGTYACLLGPSGSGKSTLLYAIAGVLRPSQGSIAIDGRTVVDRASFVPPEARGLGMVFQDYALWPHLSALENVAFPLRARGRADAARAAEALLERMGLAEFAPRRPDDLSGGQKQRVALARALAASPALVLLDEPLSALDATVRFELRAYLAHLSREFGLTALHVTHDPDEAFYLADVVGVMLDGQLVQWDTPATIYRQPHDARVARITGPATVVSLVPRAVRDGRATIELAGRRLDVAADPRLAAGDRAELILRPDAIVVTALDQPDAFVGTAREPRFAGDHYAVDVVLRDGTPLAVHAGTPLQGDVALSIRTEQAWLAPPGGTGS